MSYKTYLTNDKENPQRSPIAGREKDMSRNEAGGFAFNISKWKRLERFLILGSEGGTYYVNEQSLRDQNLDNFNECLMENGLRVVNTIVDISDSGRAPKNDAALFLLARCCAASDIVTRRLALDSIPKVARTSTHLFHFLSYVKETRGMGRGLRTALCNWYDNFSVDSLIFQVTKYKNRDGWTHRDVLRIAHPKTTDSNKNKVYGWVVHGYDDAYDPDTSYTKALNALSGETPEDVKVELVKNYSIPMECIPTTSRTTEIYKAVAETGGITWLLRNIRNMQKNGALDSDVSILDKLTDVTILKKARIHPVQVLQAILNIDKSIDNSKTISSILQKAFLLSFKCVEPTGKRILVGLDVSGSMGEHWMGSSQSQQSGTGLTPASASAAMCMTHLRTEENITIRGFSGKFIDLGIGQDDSLETIMRKTDRSDFGSTDASLPMEWAYDEGHLFDAFIIYTDNETGSSWGTRSHPYEALLKYRKELVPHAQGIVVAMTATRHSILGEDANKAHDPGVLDVVGFDAAAPSIISAFMRGEV